MAIVRYTGNPLSITCAGYRFLRDDRRPKLVDDKFVAYLKKDGKHNAKYFEVILEKGAPGDKTTAQGKKGGTEDPGTGGTVTIRLGDEGVDQNDVPGLPMNGFETREAAISFAVDELGLDIEGDKEVAKRYAKTLALPTLNRNLVEDYTEKFGAPEWLGGADGEEETASDVEALGGIDDFDTAAGSFSESEGVAV